jgi:predicted GNAT family acetyltransferase
MDPLPPFTREATATGERLTARFEGGLVAEITWRDEGPVTRVIDHTRVPGALAGRGIAAALTEAALEAAQLEARQVRPDCSYVAAHIARHPRWRPLLAD